MSEKKELSEKAQLIFVGMFLSFLLALTYIIVSAF